MMIGDDNEDQFREFFGPGTVDSQLRQIISLAWMVLPEDRKTLEELEKMVRHFVDRAFRDLHEDRDAFGLPG